MYGVAPVLAASPRWIKIFNADSGFGVSTRANLGSFLLKWQASPTPSVEAA